MWLLVVLYIQSGEPEVELIYTDTQEECYREHRGVKSIALRNRMPVSLVCMQVPKASWTEEQM